MEQKELRKSIFDKSILSKLDKIKEKEFKVEYYKPGLEENNLGVTLKYSDTIINDHRIRNLNNLKDFTKQMLKVKI
jgi:glycerol-3-phosphate dehydrogenase